MVFLKVTYDIVPMKDTSEPLDEIGGTIYENLCCRVKLFHWLSFC